MKKYLLLLVTTILATFAHAADGDTFTFEGIKYTILSEADHTVEVGYNVGVSGEVNIPTFVTYGSSRYVVTSIGERAFKWCRSVTSVTIPNSVTEISLGTFYGCSSLTTVTIPNSVTSIGNSAFADCSSLTSVTIPNSVTEIGEWTFCGCSSLTSVTIPNSVTSIGSYAFRYCSSLTSVTIPNSVTSIGIEAFSYCSSLTSVTIPNSVTSIGTIAFLDCTSLTSVTIPDSVTEIGEWTFKGCSNLTKIIDLNPTPQCVGRSVFYDVPAVAVVYIPKGSYEAYTNSYYWTKFTDFREMGALDISISASTIELAAGVSADLSVTVVMDDDVTAGDDEWVSSNQKVATVENGKVTAVAPGTAVITYTIYDGYGVAHSESCVVTVPDENNSVGMIGDDADATVDAFTLQGVAVLRNAPMEAVRSLPAGIYIIHQGQTTRKIAVK